MAYSTRNWWAELAVFLLVTVVVAGLLILLWVGAQDGSGATASLWGFVVPGGLVGLWAARRYRRGRGGG